MINNVILTGRLTKKPELTQTPNGVAKLAFNIAVNRSFANQNGEKETDFVLCVAWRKTAETMAAHLQKGSLIGVEGRIATRNYDGKDGNKVFVTEVSVENFTFLESRNNNQSQGNTQANSQQQNYSQQSNNQQPNNNQQYQQQPNQQSQQQYQNQNQNYQQPQQGQPQYAGANTGYGNQNQGGTSSFPVSDDDLPF